MEPKLRIAAITDEFSPDLPTAVAAMAPIGMTGVELRVVSGKNIMDLSAEEVDRALEEVTRNSMQVISIASPLLKCVLPNAPAVDTRFQQDIFASKHTFADQPRLADHAFHLARKTGASIIRVFSYWRTVEPEACFEAVCRAMEDLAQRAQGEGVIIGLENEHACNIGTATEAARVLEAVNHPHLQLVWDPANAMVAGEEPFPHGYEQLPKNRIAHVHVKDCHMEGPQPVWGPVGTRRVDWKGQVAALLADGYSGYLSLETHWPGPQGNKLEGSTICGWNLRGLAAA